MTLTKIATTSRWWRWLVASCNPDSNLDAAADDDDDNNDEDDDNDDDDDVDDND